MNIYDEAIETLKEVMYDLTRDENDNKGLTIEQIIDKLLSTKKALERAKKEHELLEWYRESWKTMRDGCLESKINKLEKELEEMK